MTVTINELKSYLRLDTCDEDSFLYDTISAAQKHIENVLGTTFDEVDDTARRGPLKQALLMLSAHWYEVRGVACSDTMRPFPYSVQEILNEYREFSF